MARDWHCSTCRQVLGTITVQNDLIVKLPAALVERTRTGAIVHCSCGNTMLFKGRRVIMNPSVLQRVLQSD